MLGSFIAAAKAEPLAAMAVVVLLGIGLYLLADKMAGIADIRFERDSSKQFYRKDTGEPAHYLVQAQFKNHSNQEAEGVSAQVDAWGKSRVVAGALCRWAQGATPLATGFDTHQPATDIHPGHIPARLNIAIRQHDEQAYLFTSENEHAHPDLRHPAFALDAGPVLMRVSLRGKGASETCWLLFKNDQQPSLRQLWTGRAWWWWLKLARARREPMPFPAGSLAGASDQTETALQEFAGAPQTTRPTLAERFRAFQKRVEAKQPASTFRIWVQFTGVHIATQAEIRLRLHVVHRSKEDRVSLEFYLYQRDQELECWYHEGETPGHRHPPISLEPQTDSERELIFRKELAGRTALELPTINVEGLVLRMSDRISGRVTDRRPDGSTEWY